MQRRVRRFVDAAAARERHRRWSRLAAWGSRLVLAAFLLATLGLSSRADAATITFMDQAPLSDVEISGTLSVARFDSSLGVLTGVSWSITGAIASILGIENDSAGTIRGSASTNVDFDVDSADLSLGASPDFSVSGSTGLVTLGVGESALFPITSQNTITGTEAPSAVFLGPGTIDLTYLTATSFGGSGFGGDLTLSQVTDAGITFSITYEYTVVPEPGSLAMLAAGLLGLAGAARVRRA